MYLSSCKSEESFVGRQSRRSFLQFGGAHSRPPLHQLSCLSLSLFPLNCSLPLLGPHILTSQLVRVISRWVPNVQTRSRVGSVFLSHSPALRSQSPSEHSLLLLSSPLLLTSRLYQAVHVIHQQLSERATDLAVGTHVSTLEVI